MTFIEVILAVAIIGSVLTALFSLQTGIFSAIFNDYSRISRVFYLKNFFFDYDSFQKVQQEKNIKMDLKEPITKLTYETKKISEKSSLKKFENVSLFKATAKWRGLIRDQEESIVSFIYIKPKKKKEQ